MSPVTNFPAADDYLALFEKYRGVTGGRDFGEAYLEPEDERYRLLFEQVCRLLLKPSAFNYAMPREFRRTAALYVAGDAAMLARMRSAEMRHFMLSDLYDYAHLSRALGRSR